MSRHYSSLFSSDLIGGARAMVLHLAAHAVEKMEGLAVEFGCGLCGDEGQFFWPG